MNDVLWQFQLSSGFRVLKTVLLLTEIKTKTAKNTAELKTEIKLK